MGGARSAARGAWRSVLPAGQAGCARSNLYALEDARHDRHMAKWLPPQLEVPDGAEHLATLLIISTPDGFRTRWEGDEPSAVVRSEVSEFARQMSMDDFINAPRIEPRDVQHFDEQRLLGDTARHDESNADEVREIPREEEFGRIVYLRLNVRACTAEQAAAWGRERVIDF
jgi:hypothetical protein